MTHASEPQRAIYAHSLGCDPKDWEPLGEHLVEVADLAAGSAGAFGAAEWGRAAGQWHDLGKGSAEFQAYLHQTSDPDASEEGRGPDHSTFGARHADATMPGGPGRLLAFCIAGHHAGLPDA